jgi:hypothetical protein
MRDKNYNTGVKGVLLDARHYERMGSALWLYSWLILRQTHQTGAIGWVLGGAPVSHREIEEETGFNRRTIEAWFRKLRRAGYIETTAAPTGVVVRIMKAKKFAQTPRRNVEGVREVAYPSPPNCAAIDPQNAQIERVPDRIGSSSVVRIKERTTTPEIHKHLHKEIHRRSQIHPQNLSGLGKQTSKSCALSYAEHNEIENSDNDYHRHQNLNQGYFVDARTLEGLLRWEREEAVRRELRVGTGPEVRRS